MTSSGRVELSDNDWSSSGVLACVITVPVGEALIEATTPKSTSIMLYKPVDQNNNQDGKEV